MNAPSLWRVCVQSRDRELEGVRGVEIDQVVVEGGYDVGVDGQVLRQVTLSLVASSTLATVSVGRKLVS